jgi:hypothetical protein
MTTMPYPPTFPNHPSPSAAADAQRRSRRRGRRRDKRRTGTRSMTPHARLMWRSTSGVRRRLRRLGSGRLYCMRIDGRGRGGGVGVGVVVGVIRGATRMVAEGEELAWALRRLSNCALRRRLSSPGQLWCIMMRRVMMRMRGGWPCPAPHHLPLHLHQSSQQSRWMRTSTCLHRHRHHHHQKARQNHHKKVRSPALQSATKFHHRHLLLQRLKTTI